MNKVEIDRLKKQYPYFLNLPSWQRVLLFLYTRHSFSNIIYEKPGADPTLNSLKISGKYFDCLNSMVNNDLIKKNHAGKEGDYDYYKYHLTTSGLEASREIINHQNSLQSHKDSNILGIGMFCLTAILTLSGFFELTSELFNVPKKPTLAWTLFIIYILSLIILSVIYFKERIK